MLPSRHTTNIKIALTAVRAVDWCSELVRNIALYLGVLFIVNTPYSDIFTRRSIRTTRLYHRNVLIRLIFLWNKVVCTKRDQWGAKYRQYEPLLHIFMLKYY